MRTSNLEFSFYSLAFVLLLSMITLLHNIQENIDARFAHESAVITITRSWKYDPAYESNYYDYNNTDCEPDPDSTEIGQPPLDTGHLDATATEGYELLRVNPNAEVTDY